jgi:hypothetical protein
MYKWYDGLKEPKRFLVFFIPAATLIVGTNIAAYGINYVSWALLLTALVTRIVHIHWGKKS